MATFDNVTDSEGPPGNQGGSSATGKSPRLSAQEAEELVLVHYGFRGTAERIAGERDDNFCVRNEEGTAIFLKVAHIHEAEVVTNLATCALLHVAEDEPRIPIQRIVPDREGNTEIELVLSDGSSRRARVTTFLEGRMLRSVPSGRDLRLQLGRTLAHLNRSLRTFQHPGMDHQHLLWDVRRSAELRQLIDVARPDHELLVQWLDHFDSETHPRMIQLRSQAVHNDFSRDNILVDEKGQTVVGILDFGDLIHAPLVNDVAIAAYQLWDFTDPLESSVDFVAGYHEIDPLLESEVALLYDLMVMRIVWRITISEWRAERFPENRNYILRNTVQAWSEFEVLRKMSREHVTERMMRVCVVGEVG